MNYYFTTIKIFKVLGILFYLSVIPTRHIAQNRVNPIRIDVITHQMARNLQEPLGLSEDKMCQVQLILYDNMMDFHLSEDVVTPDSIRFRNAQELFFKMIEEILSPEEVEKLEPIKYFSLNASQKEKRNRRLFMNMNKLSESGKVLDASRLIKSSK